MPKKDDYTMTLKVGDKETGPFTSEQFKAASEKMIESLKNSCAFGLKSHVYTALIVPKVTKSKADGLQRTDLTFTMEVSADDLSETQWWDILFSVKAPLEPIQEELPGIERQAELTVHRLNSVKVDAIESEFDILVLKSPDGNDSLKLSSFFPIDLVEIVPRTSSPGAILKIVMHQLSHKIAALGKGWLGEYFQIQFVRKSA